MDLAAGATISDLGEEHGHRVLRVRRKGGKFVLVPANERSPKLSHEIVFAPHLCGSRRKERSMKFGNTLIAGLAVATGAAIAALVVSTAAGTTMASGSNTVFVRGGVSGGGGFSLEGDSAAVTLASGSNTVFAPRGVGLARNGETGILFAGAGFDRGGETGTLFTNGTGGGTATPSHSSGMTGGTGI